MPNFTCQSKSFISIFFTCQVSACELRPFSCHDLANDIYSQIAKTVLSHLKLVFLCQKTKILNDTILANHKRFVSSENQLILQKTVKKILEG